MFYSLRGCCLCGLGLLLLLWVVVVCLVRLGLWVLLLRPFPFFFHLLFFVVYFLGKDAGVLNIKVRCMFQSVRYDKNDLVVSEAETTTFLTFRDDVKSDALSNS